MINNLNSEMTCKRGSFALGWVVIIAISILLIALAFPRLQSAVDTTGEPIAEELGEIVDTSQGNDIMRYKSTNEE